LDWDSLIVCVRTKVPDDEKRLSYDGSNHDAPTRDDDE